MMTLSKYILRLSDDEERVYDSMTTGKVEGGNTPGTTTPFSSFSIESSEGKIGKRRERGERRRRWKREWTEGGTERTEVSTVFPKKVKVFIMSGGAV